MTPEFLKALPADLVIRGLFRTVLGVCKVFVDLCRLSSCKCWKALASVGDPESSNRRELATEGGSIQVLEGAGDLVSWL